MSTTSPPPDSLFAQATAGQSVKGQGRPDALTIDERWAPVPEWEGLYEVSDHGRVRSIEQDDPTRRHAGRVLSTAPDFHGYPAITLNDRSRMRRFQVHRLVALAFIPNPGGLPVVMHKDESRDNNHYLNLRWGTQSDNLRQANRSGRNRPPVIRGEQVKISKLNREQVRVIRRCVEIGIGHDWVASIFAVTRTTVRHIATGRTWKHVQHGGPLKAARKAS